MSDKRQVALKISRNKKFDIDNARVEDKILTKIKEKDPDDKQGLVRIKDTFMFRKHMVLVFEYHGKNLYKYLRNDYPKGLPKMKIRNIAFQVLNSLAFLKQVGIIHCDLKPENILF